MKKVAVVGFGHMGMTHTLKLMEMKDVELVAIVTRNIAGISTKLHAEIGNFSTGKLEEEALGSIRKYSSLESCLAAETLDAVHICVHTDLHFELTKMALSAGINVFLEKPMVLDIPQGEALIEWAAHHQCLLMVGQVVRFMPPYEQLKSWVDSREFGKLKFLSLSRFSGLPAWGQWKEKQEQFGSSGGALFDLLIHDIDYAHYLLGMPDKIESTILPGSLSRHDYVSAFWTYPETTVKIEGGNTFHTGFPFQAGFMATFEMASVHYTTLKPDIIHLSENGATSEVATGVGPDGFYKEIDYFYQCLENGEQPTKCMPQSALDTIRLCYRHID